MRDVPIPSEAIGLGISLLPNGERDPSRPADLISIASTLIPGKGRIRLASEDTEDFVQLQKLVWNIIRSRARKINSVLGHNHEVPDLANTVDLVTKTMPFGAKKEGSSGQSRMAFQPHEAQSSQADAGCDIGCGQLA
jgi:hypothetical protein